MVVFYTPGARLLGVDMFLPRQEAVTLRRDNPPISEGGGQIIAVDVAFLFLGSVMVTLRVVARRLKRAALVAEDHVLFVALVGFLVSEFNDLDT